MPPIDTTTVNNLALSMLIAGVLGAVVSAMCVKAPYLRVLFAKVDGKKFAGESIQLLIVIVLTTGLGLLAFLYVHRAALSTITPDDILPLVLTIGTAIGTSQWYNASVNKPEAAGATITVPSSPGSAAVAITPQPVPVPQPVLAPPAIPPAADKPIGG